MKGVHTDKAKDVWMYLRPSSGSIAGLLSLSQIEMRVQRNSEVSYSLLCSCHIVMTYCGVVTQKRVEGIPNKDLIHHVLLRLPFPPWVHAK